MKNFKICQKLNYATESLEKQVEVDLVTKTINEKMLSAGFRVAEKSDKIIDYIFSVGGDGTMMHSMHHHLVKSSIIIGINAGNVGFLTPYNISDVMSSDIFSFLDKTPRVEKRSILTNSFRGKKGIAVNEFAITAPGPNDMLEFSIEVEHRGHVSRAGHYRANAVIVSGPCGSTAYNMNAGGAIVDPSVKCMQVVMVAPTTLGSRPFIVGKNSKVHVNVLSPAKIYADGVLSGEVDPKGENKVSVSLMAKESNILVPENWNFYSVLSKKLHWNNGKEV